MFCVVCQWSLLGHDEGEKLTLRSVLASQPAGAAAAAASDDDSSSIPESASAPSPLTEPNDRRRPVMDVIASKLSLPPTYNQLWTSEAEPEPADLDRWARGVIPTLKSSTHAAGIDSLASTAAFTVQDSGDISALPPLPPSAPPLVATLLALPVLANPFL
jgi:hypothetical protein